MLLFIDFCGCHWLLPWLLPFVLGSILGWLLGAGRGKKETVIEEKIVYKDKIVYQDKIVYKDAPAASVATGIAGTAAASKSTKKETPKPATKAKVKSADKEDDYLSCKEYEGHKVNDTINNVALFKHDADGQYYFAMYKADSSVKLRSEGFRTAKERDQELSGVLRFHDDESMYKTLTKGQYSMRVLYDETGREVGRSCLIKKAAKKAAASAKKAKVESSTPTKAAAIPTAPKAKASIYSKLKNDNLQIVEGIGPKMDEVLKKHGVNTWKELASKSSKELRGILDKENPTRYRIIDPTTWPDQAKMAASDNWEGLIRFQKSLDTGRSNVGDGETDAKIEKLLIKMGLIKKWKQDDLKAVEGIGPKIEGLLKDAGINTWLKLSKAPVADLQEVLNKAGSRYKLADPGSWPKQAEFAATGKWDDLQEYQDFLVGGK